MSRPKLVDRISCLSPDADDRELARTWLLLANTCAAPAELDHDELREAWREVGLKMQLATDQHAAMTQELEELAQSDPSEFSKDQVWILLRAIKVQSQLLELYLGQPALDV